MRTLTPSLITEKNKLGSTSPWILLYEIQVDATPTSYYFAAYPESVDWNGVTWTPMGVRHTDFKEDAKGSIPSATLTIGDPLRIVGNTLEAGENIIGYTTKIHLVHSTYLTDPSAAVTHEYEVTGATLTQDAVSLTLGLSGLIVRSFPSNRFLRDSCRWRYKSTECGYIGALASCDKTLQGGDGCESHNNEPRFGGFPSIPTNGLIYFIK